LAGTWVSCEHHHRPHLFTLVPGIPWNETSSFRLQIAEYGEQILGDHLLGLQCGNEPDLYVDHGHRPSNYTQYDYFGEFGDVIKAIAADDLIPVRNNLIGPSVASATWTPEMVWDTGFVTTYSEQLGALAVEQCVGLKLVIAIVLKLMGLLATLTTIALRSSALAPTSILRRSSRATFSTVPPSSLCNRISTQQRTRSRIINHSSCLKPILLHVVVSRASATVLVVHFGRLITGCKWRTLTSPMVFSTLVDRVSITTHLLVSLLAFIIDHPFLTPTFSSTH
jgi:hypothetical protein